MIHSKHRLVRTVQTPLLALVLALLLGTGFLAPAAQAQAEEFKPFATVALNSVDNIMEDVNFIGGLVGSPQMADQIRPMIDGFAQGLDKTKPIGLMVRMGDMGPAGAICIPVTNFQQLTQNLMMWGVNTKKDGDIYEISAQGQKLVAKEANGWATLSMMPEMLEGLPADPGQILGELSSEYDLGIRIDVQNIPPQYRAMAVEQLQAGMDAGSQQKADESDEDYQARKEVAQVQIDQIKRAINELDQLTLGLAFDGANQRTFLDVVYTAVPGTQLAEQVSLNKDPKTNYAGFFQPDAAMMLSFASKASQSDIANMQQVFEVLRKQAYSALDKEASDKSDEDRALMKSAIDDFMGAMVSTLQEGSLDGGAVLNLAPNSLTLVAGGLVVDAAKVESGLKKLTEMAEKEDDDFPGFKWGADSHAGVKFHTMSVPIPEHEEKPRQLFGDTVEVAVGIGTESVFFGMGRDCLQSIKDVIDRSQANPGKSIAPMEMTFALQQILEVIGAMSEGEEKANIEMIAGMLAGSSDGRDHVRIVAQMIPNGVRTRIELEEGVLRAIGMGAMQQRMQGAGAPGGF